MVEYSKKSERYEVSSDKRDFVPALASHPVNHHSSPLNSTAMQNAKETNEQQLQDQETLTLTLDSKTMKTLKLVAKAQGRTPKKWTELKIKGIVMKFAEIMKDYNEANINEPPFPGVK